MLARAAREQLGVRELDALGQLYDYLWWIRPIGGIDVIRVAGSKSEQVTTRGFDGRQRRVSSSLRSRRRSNARRFHRHSHSRGYRYRNRPISLRAAVPRRRASPARVLSVFVHANVRVSQRALGFSSSTSPATPPSRPPRGLALDHAHITIPRIARDVRVLVLRVDQPPVGGVFERASRPARRSRVVVHRAVARRQPSATETGRIESASARARRDRDERAARERAEGDFSPSRHL